MAMTRNMTRRPSRVTGGHRIFARMTEAFHGQS